MMNKTGYTLSIHFAAAAMYLLTVSGGFAQNGVVPTDRPTPPGALSQITVPLPNLTGYVVDRQAAIVLGKAFFWDQQSGSDGLGCASCHFHAGADNRVKNSVDPGLRNTNPALQNIFDPRGSGKKGAANTTLSQGDFPFHRLADKNNRNSAVLFDSNDIAGSQGVFSGIFSGMKLDSTTKQSEVCASSLSSTFSVGGINTRAVEPRNTPTVINAIFNFRNFWDGRANNIFNGRNPFGMRDPTAGSDPYNSVLVADPISGALSPFKVAIADASLASQAVGPPGSNLEMSCAGRGFEQIGQKLLLRNASTGVAVTVPLFGQTVDPTDSVLGPYAGKPGKGLTISYEALIKKAFDPRFWNSGNTTGDGFRQIEKNFSLFWGLAIASYESTLVSGDTPFDRFISGADQTAMTTQQIRGFQVFNGNGNCVFCHRSAEFTGAGTTMKELASEGSLIEHMQMSDGLGALYDSGSYNIGVRPTGDDIGVGGTDNWGNPLSWARQLTNYLAANPFSSSMSGVGLDQISVATCSFQFEQCATVTATDRDAIDGSFKVPTLRNVELTGPYFHNGGQATLEQVVDFYNRGGDGAGTDMANTTGFGPNQTNRAPAILPLNLSDDDKAALVAFLKALTDERVRYERAPFDHPSLSVPNGHQFNETSVLRNGTTSYAIDTMMAIPAVGAAGKTTPILPFDAGLAK